jgi:hypothetical protein
MTNLTLSRRLCRLALVPGILLAASVSVHAQTAPPGDVAVRVTPPLEDPAGQSTANAPTADASSSASSSSLAEKLQNPIGDVYSIPFQSNTNFNVGPNKGTQEILNIQPVIPIHVTPDWNIITRTIVPLTWSPSYQPAADVPPFGLSVTSFSAFLSPTKPIDDWVWGVGTIIGIPTSTNKTLGSNLWGAGPAAVLVRAKHPWVYGVLVNDLISFGGTSGPAGNQYNLMTINPFANYNFGKGWFVGSSSIMTADWATGGEKWTIPVGAQFGRLIKLGGKLPVNLLVGAYYNALRPQGVGTWQLRTQITIVF